MQREWATLLCRRGQPPRTNRFGPQTGQWYGMPSVGRLDVPQVTQAQEFPAHPGPQADEQRSPPATVPGSRSPHIDGARDTASASDQHTHSDNTSNTLKTIYTKAARGDLSATEMEEFIAAREYAPPVADLIRKAAAALAARNAALMASHAAMRSRYTLDDESSAALCYTLRVIPGLDRPSRGSQVPVDTGSDKA